MKSDNLCVISGSEDLLRLRFLRELVRSYQDKGYLIEYVDGADTSEIRNALQTNLFGAEQRLVVVDNPEKTEVSLYTKHAASGDPDVILVLHFEGDPKGNTKFGKFVTECRHKSFKAPPEWDAGGAAVRFVTQEAAAAGKVLSEPFAHALVQKSGTDLGVLAFEIKKAVTFADMSASSELSADHLKAAIAPIGEVSLQPLLAALGLRNLSRVLKALSRFQAGAKGDQTMRVCRFLSPQVLLWFQAACLLGTSPAEAAVLLDQNPWYFTNKIIPVARRWGPDPLRSLLKSLAQVERAVLSGSISPWLVLETGIAMACRNPSAVGV